jgi:hypoxanthine phosphoribosyltransferase
MTPPLKSTLDQEFVQAALLSALPHSHRSCREPAVRDIPLRDLAKAAQGLGEVVEAAGFKPDCIVYIETAGRLIASEICQQFRVGGLPLRVQRRTGRLKERVAPWLASLPDALRNRLRVWESRLTLRHSQHHRQVIAPPAVNLSGLNVLIVDDAVDTGSSIRLARQWVEAMGASRAQVKTGALTVTTDQGWPEVDFHLFEQLCRFPWSSDSRERKRYLSIYEETCVQPFIPAVVA